MPARVHQWIPKIAADQSTVLMGQTRNEQVMVLHAQVLRPSQKEDVQDAGKVPGHVDITRTCENPSGQSNLCLSLPLWIASKCPPGSGLSSLEHRVDAGDSMILPHLLRVRVSWI